VSSFLPKQWKSTNPSSSDVGFADENPRLGGAAPGGGILSSALAGLMLEGVLALCARSMEPRTVSGMLIR
jgi:hypothetical protein